MSRPRAKGPIRTLVSGWARDLERAAHSPREAQARALARVVAECGGSEVGRRFGLHRVRGPDDARRLPVTDYSILSEELARARSLGVDGAGIFGRSCLVAFGQT